MNDAASRNGVALARAERAALQELIRRDVAADAAPLPRPVVLRGYDAVLPGLAERIVVSVEKEHAHRRVIEQRRAEIEGRIADAQIYATKFELWRSSLIGVLALVVASVPAALGHPILNGFDLATFLATFGLVSASGTARRRVVQNVDVVRAAKPASR
jgi:uncharacterized membrane protein